MRDWGRPTNQWSVTLLGTVLLFLTVGWAITTEEELVTDFLEVGLPFVIGLGLVVGGVWLSREHSPSRIRRLSFWAIGGATIGVAVNLWFMFIISIEQVPAGEPVVLNLNGAGIFMTAGILIGYYSTGLQGCGRDLALSEARFRIVQISWL